MHSFGYRANALLTFAVTALAFICAIASFSDKFSNQNPSVEIQVMECVCLWFTCIDRFSSAADLRMNALICDWIKLFKTLILDSGIVVDELILIWGILMKMSNVVSMGFWNHGFLVCVVVADT